MNYPRKKPVHKEMLIYTVSDELLDSIVKHYIDYVTNPRNEMRQEQTNINMYTGEIEYNNGKGIIDMPLATHKDMWGELKVDVENLPKPQYAKTKYIFMALLHNIYSRYANTEPRIDGSWFFLSSEALKEIDDNYLYKLKYLIFTTKFKESLLRWRTYDETRCMYTIKNPEMFIQKKCTFPDVILKIEIIHNVLNEIADNKLKEAKQQFSLKDEYIEHYRKSIQHLQLIDEEGARIVANSQEPNNPDSEINVPALYYNNIINKLQDRDIKNLSVDDNGRTYHIGTKLPRELKRFTNIKYTLDCKNSHLVLFNNLILLYYLNKSVVTISNNYNYQYNNSYYKLNYYILSNLYTNINTYHYFVANICKILKDNRLEDDVIANIKNIPKDVWQYMYDSSHGKVWDNFIEYFYNDDDVAAIEDEEEKRAYVKQTMFANVFYDMRTRIYKENNSSKWTEKFREQYPHVWQIIVYYKKDLKRQCEEADMMKMKRGKEVPAIQLSHLMMRMESCIFTGILERLFKKRGLWVMGIHDAIVVIDGEDKCPEEKIRAIMTEEYAKYGLVPTLSKTRYH